MSLGESELKNYFANTSRALLLVLALLILFSSSGRAFTLNSSSDSGLQGWSNHTVRFQVNYTNCPSNVDSLIDTSMAVWNGVATSDLVVQRGSASTSTFAQLNGHSASDAPVILCDTSFAADTGADPSDIPGITFMSNPTAGGNVSYAYLVLNVQSGASANINSFSQAIVTIVMAHEIGHALGLGHSPDANALMYYNASAKTTLGLAQDDIDGITYLYPRNELNGNQFLGCGLVASALSGGGGWKGPGPSGSALSLIALLWFLPVVTAFALRRKSRAARP